ncbi:hypothetical protein SAMN04487775_101248 [Treponema bryantii]|uniref:Uncharacterized protein n=1 Tax=Treponema bryantii TaxID=163 RepID=A0A1I3I1M3_9SPIR|nr:hypothetical protein [Treponema bryantii]SFI41854.1 hypothetical protein SAMN04487775_101248 [Treponema bryantii]
MKKISSIFILAISLIFTSCYSVFSGGTGGLIVDAESTSTPKRGIANVDIYAYTDSEIRDSDYGSWREGTVFSPSNSYYGHTTTDADGSFVISNIVWKENKPDFGKDADYTTIYLLYYHENYGLTKDETVITSDSTSDTVYAELTSIRKTTALNISIYDVATSGLTSHNVLVKVSVPQSTDTLTADAKVYEQTISGNGTINISYPRWKNEADKKNGIEISPQVKISYSQSADQITWKACANADNNAQNYAFIDNPSINKTISNSSYNISLYGKSTRISYPTVSGTCGSADGAVVRMLAKDSSGNFTIDCGETTTYAQTIGTSGTQTHGNFSNLGNGYYWTDTTYTERYSTQEVQLSGSGSTKNLTLRSDVPSYTVSF